MCRVGGGHEKSHKTASRTKARPLKTGHNPKSQNKWGIILLGPKGDEKRWMQGAKMEDTCREKARPGTPGPQECIQAHLDPGKFR